MHVTGASCLLRSPERTRINSACFEGYKIGSGIRPEQRRHVVVCLLKYQWANYSSGSFAWSSKLIQLNFGGFLKRCEKKNCAAERFTAEEFSEQVAPSDFDENEYETKWRQRRGGCWRPSRCARCRSPHVGATAASVMPSSWTMMKWNPDVFYGWSPGRV